MPESDAQRRRAQTPASVRNAEYNARRESDPTSAYATEVYHSMRWRILRSIHLNMEPLCRACYANGEQIVPAVLVDHVVPIRVDPSLAYTQSNFQSLCAACHNVKTARERAYVPAVGAQAPAVKSLDAAPLTWPPVPQDVGARYLTRGSRWARR